MRPDLTIAECLQVGLFSNLTQEFYGVPDLLHGGKREMSIGSEGVSLRLLDKSEVPQ